MKTYHCTLLIPSVGLTFRTDVVTAGDPADSLASLFPNCPIVSIIEE